MQEFSSTSYFIVLELVDINTAHLVFPRIQTAMLKSLRSCIISVSPNIEATQRQGASPTV